MDISKCCVFGCPSTNASTRLYNFPADIGLTSAWVKLISTRSPEKGGALDPGNKETKVCRIHFEDKYFQGWTRTYYAIPTLFNEEEILSRVPSQKISISHEEISPQYIQDIKNDDVEKFIKSSIQLDHSYERNRVKLMLHDETGTKEIDFDLLPSSVLLKSADKMGMQGKESNGPTRLSYGIPAYVTETTQPAGCPPQNKLQRRLVCGSTPMAQMEVKLKRIEKPPQIENFKPILIQSIFKTTENIEKLPQNGCVNLSPSHVMSSKIINNKEPTRLVNIGSKPTPLPLTTMDKPSIQSVKQRSETFFEKRLNKRLKQSKYTIKALRKKITEFRKQAKSIGSIKSPTLKDLIEAVIHNQKRKEGGKRWPESIKSVALNIYKKSPSAYRYISELFELPCVATVKKSRRAECADPVLKIRSKTKENELSDLLYKRIKTITQNPAGTRKPLNMKILIKGDKGVGKSCLLQRLQGGPFIQKYVPSVETQLAPIHWASKNTDCTVRVEAWDVVDKGAKKQTLGFGQEASSLNVYKNANAVILMMDVTKPQTCEYLEQEVSRVPTDLPVLILGNHCDMPHLRRVYPHHIEYLLQQARLNRSAPVLYTESSMRNGFGLRLLHQFLGVPLLRMQCASLLEQLQRCQRDAEHLERQIALFQNSEEANYDTFAERLRSGSRQQPAQPRPSVPSSTNNKVALSQPLKPKATERKAESTPSTTSQQECTRSCAYTELLKHNRVVSVETIPSAQTRQHSRGGAAVGALDDFYVCALDSNFIDELPVAANQEQAYVSDSEDGDNKNLIVESTRSNVLPGHKNSNNVNKYSKLKKYKETIDSPTFRSDMSMPSLDTDFALWGSHTSARRPGNSSSSRRSKRSPNH